MSGTTPIRETDPELAAIKKINRELAKLPEGRRIPVLDFIRHRALQEQLQLLKMLPQPDAPEPVVDPVRY